MVRRPPRGFKPKLRGAGRSRPSIIMPAGPDQFPLVRLPERCEDPSGSFWREDEIIVRQADLLELSHHETCRGLCGGWDDWVPVLEFVLCPCLERVAAYAPVLLDNVARRDANPRHRVVGNVTRSGGLRVLTVHALERFHDQMASGDMSFLDHRLANAPDKLR